MKLETAMTASSDLDLLFRLAVAAMLAVPLGLEREASGKAAGLRTHMLVCVSAAFFVVLAEVMVSRYDGKTTTKLDPLVTLGAVATGVSFLGAGTIFVSRSGGGVQGLTTAASVLATSAVGVAVGLERYLLAAGAVVILFVVLNLLGRVSANTAKPPGQKP
jgi:putative Mg2+ transporter-C (MgtC) family protein